MSDLFRILVACNDPDNGLFARKAARIEYADERELEPQNWEGYAFTEGPGWIRIHRRKFKVRQSKEWFGNWCWNAYWLTKPEAKRLIGTLRDSGLWGCTCAPTHFYNWFNGEGLLAFALDERVRSRKAKAA